MFKSKYLAKKGWKPRNPEQNYIITLIKIEPSKAAKLEAKKQKRNDKDLFRSITAAVAAESSTGTWTKVYSGKDSGAKMANKERAIAYDLDFKNQMFKVAYPITLFEKDNISGLLAGVVGNIAGMKLVSAMRVFDIRFPKHFIKSFPGPKFGVKGVRKFLKKKEGPLLATVPKPKVGRTAKEQARLAKILFTSGDGTYEGIKDDENLTSLYFSNFKKRAKLVFKEVKKAEKKTQNKKFYLCNITHSNLDTMVERANFIKKQGGNFMMIDVVCTGFTAIDSMRRKNLNLAIHAHRAMHGFMTRDNSPGVNGKGKIQGFSVSMIFLAKLFRLLGVDSLHGGSPLAKMEDYGQAKYIQRILQEKNLLPDKEIPSLGQNWYNIKPVWMTASGGLHPGDLEAVIKILGKDLIIQCGGGLLGHPDGPEAGVLALEQARVAVLKGIKIKDWVKNHPHSPLSKAIEYWGYGPKIVY